MMKKTVTRTVSNGPVTESHSPRTIEGKEGKREGRNQRQRRKKKKKARLGETAVERLREDQGEEGAGGEERERERSVGRQY